ncbi:MAG TPA: carbohydrate binding domain-containing protein [Armatimonadota bacterium]|nr:carbohydrate binding domain-containing protein [Armatimonadota bacterium]
MCVLGTVAFAAEAGNLVPNGDFANGTNSWWVTSGDVCKSSVVPATAGKFTTALHLELAPKAGAKPWDIVMGRTVPANMKTGERYTARVWMRSPAANNKITFYVSLAKEPYTTQFGDTFTLTPEWKEYQITGALNMDLPSGNGNVGLHLGAATGVVEVTGFQLIPVGEPPMNPHNLIPFVLPWDDATPGLTNVSSWLDAPAGKSGFIAVKGNHLYAGTQRFRMFGTNITGASCFPSHAEAEKIAGRLAKFGINCVRLHHMDNGWERSIFLGDKKTLDPEQLDKLDYFVAQMKQRGIYVNINLHVSNEYPGMPRWAGMPSFFKGVDLFYQPMLDFQREYARNLLTHTNPYTKLRYVDDPTVALVEINNENGFTSSWQWGSLDNMPAVYATALQQRWNAWLTKRYGSSEKLHAAWAPPKSEPLGADLLVNTAFTDGTKNWYAEVQNPVKATMSEEDKVGPKGENALRVTVTDPGTNWYCQIMQTGKVITKGQLYTITFQAKANPPRKFSIDVMMAHDPWRHLFDAGEIPLTNDWKTYTYTFTAPDDEPNGRLTFGSLGDKVGSVWLTNVSLRPGGVDGVMPTQDLGSVPFITSAYFKQTTKAVKNDWNRFMWDLETDYWTGMAAYLKKDLQVKCPVVGTASGFSPASVQAELDVVDAHTYWQHPSFPGAGWDSKNWYINNIPQAGVPNGGSLVGVGTFRYLDKPYIVTEYNEPEPLTFGSETMPMLAAYARLQDWDGIFSFCYNNGKWDSQYANDYFGFNQSPTRMATMPAAAALFLRGDVQVPSKSSVAKLTREQANTGVSWSVSTSTFGVPAITMLQRPIGLSYTAVPNSVPAAPIAPGKPIVSDTGELTWVPDNTHGVVTVNTAKSKAVIGDISRAPFTLGNVVIAPKPNLQNWAVITMTVMDGTSFATPGRILVTATGMHENTGMVWDSDPLVRSKNSTKGGWGKAPSLIEGIPATITLPVPANRVHVWALDEHGQRTTTAVPVANTNNQAAIDLGPQYRTLWYEIDIQ